MIPENKQASPAWQAARADVPAKGEPLTTAGGGSFVRGEVNRNERSPQCGVATIEVADIYANAST